MASTEPPLSVGEKVVIMGKRRGIVRFFGETAFGPGEWVGIELEKPTGTHDGGVNGQRYFTCPPNYGVYVQRQGVSSVNSSAAAASQIQSMQRGRKERQETDFKRAFQAWNTLELEEEGNFLSQSSASSRVENLLRTYGSGTAGQQNGNSATSLAAAAGVSTIPSEWGVGINVEASYTGPHISWPLTSAMVEGVLNHVRTQPDVPIHTKYMSEILGRACLHLKQTLQGSLHEMQVPDSEEGKLVICGDTHGQLADFLWVLKQNGVPGPEVAYIMNGDVADRGDYACEIFVVVLLYMLLYPDRVAINRGNHENLEMNRRPAEYGGGFYDEVARKYDLGVFMMFQQMFELLPLATVISKRVLVVHGGLTRREGVLLQHLRTINRRRQCPTSTDAIEDALMFDLMWADPQDAPGVARAPHRGSNCVRFGPDVTKRFLGSNGLSLVIRSHEVPDSLRGFEDRHDGRLITVFTASNYCGSTGNYGAVVIFHADLSFTVEEHMAPPLEQMVEEYIDELGVNKGIGAAGLLRTASSAGKVDRGKLAESMHDEVVSKVRDRVAQRKDDLWWYWTQLDGSGTGKISAALWRQGMAAGLNLDLPWFSLQKDLVQLDADGNVDYKSFLNGHKVSVSTAVLGEGWEFELANKAFEALISRDMTLQQTLRTFDADGDGLVSAQEFREAISMSKVDLPESQVNAILRVIDRDQQGLLNVDHFLDRFQVVCSLSQGGGGVGPKDEKAKQLLDRIGRTLIGSGSRVDVFQQIDIDKDGYVDEEEFSRALEALNKDGGAPLTAEDKKLAWSLLDLNNDGHLNYLEFCTAFKVVDTNAEGGKKVVNEVVEAILAALQANAATLSYAFRFFDPKGLGYVSRQDFKSGLRALNASLQGSNGRGGPLSDEQLEVFANHADADGDGKVDYQEFLAAFNNPQKKTA